MKRSTSYKLSGSWNILFQILLLALFYLLGRETVLPLAQVPQTFVIILLALIPSVIWPLFFYLGDRREPEPSGFVILAFVLGMTAMNLLILPIQESLFHVSTWMHFSLWTMISASFLLIGGLTAFGVYLLIRFAFLSSDEFDEPVDGMVYGAFIGSGMAFIQSIHYLHAHPDFTLFSMVYKTSINALVYAGASAIIGLVMSKSKFQKKNIHVSSIVAMLLGMLLIGIYSVANEFVYIRHVANAPLISSAITIVISIILLAISSRLMTTLTQKDLHQDVKMPLKFDGFVILSIFLLLGINGLIAQQTLRDVDFTDQELGLSFQYPRSLNTRFIRPILSNPARPQNRRSVFFGIDKVHKFQITISVSQKSVSLDSLQLTEILGSNQPLFLETETMWRNELRGTRIKYAYLENEPQTSAFQKIVYVFTDVVPHDNKTFYFSLHAVPQHFKKAETIYEKILRTLEWTQQEPRP